MTYRMQWAGVVLASVLLAASAAAGAATSGEALAADVPAGGPLVTEQLIYQGAAIKVQVDVDGEAAVELIGGVLDGAADIAREQAATMTEAGAGPVPPHVATMAEPLIDPARDVIKSITRVTLLVMRPDESVNPEEAMRYYHELMTSRGWRPMVTVRAEQDVRILFLLAPGGKGVFGAIIPNGDEMVVAIITTTEPLGELLAQIVRAGGGPALQQVFARTGRPAKPASEPAAAVAPCAPEESPESAPAE